MTQSNKSAPLFFQRRFFPMWTALSLGAFTDNMLKQSLSIALAYGVIVVPFIANDDAIPIVGSFFPISMLLFSTIAGQMADKFETSLMFRRTKFIEFLLMVLAAVGFITGWSLLAILALFLMGAQSAFFSPVRTGAMPKYLQTDELVRGNALCSGGLFVSVMIGITLGGLLIPQANGPMIVSSILVIASFIGWQVIRMAPTAAPNAPDLAIDLNIISQGRRLIGYAIHERGVIRPVLAVAFYWSAGAFVTVALPLFVRDTLGGDESATTMLTAMFAIGAAVGAGIASVLSKGRSGLGYSAGGVVIATVSVFIVFALGASFAPMADAELRGGAEFFADWRAIVIAMFFFIAATAMAVFAVPMQAAVQRRAPSEKRSRILAANNMINAAGATIGSWLVLFVTRTSIDPVYVFLALGVTLAAIAAYMIKRRSAVPDGLYDEVLFARNEKNVASS